MWRRSWDGRGSDSVLGCGGDHGLGGVLIRLDSSRRFFFGSCRRIGAGSILPIGAGASNRCRSIGAGRKTGTYCQFPTGTNRAFCTSVYIKNNANQI